MPGYLKHRGVLAVSLLAFIMASLVGCVGTEEQKNVSPQSITKTSTLEAIGTKISVTVTPSSKNNQSEPVESTSVSTDNIETTSDRPIEVTQNNAERCGILLPIVSELNETETTTFSSGLLPIEEFLEAGMPEAAMPAIRRIIESPGTVGLAAYQIGREQEGVFLNANNPMPLASVVKIVNLIAYAEAVSDGRLDPAEWIPLSELSRAYLPGLDLGAHNRAVGELEERSLIAGDPPATPLEEVPWMMIRHSSNAASDYIHLLLGQGVLEQTAIDLGLESQTAPCPWIGQFLIMSNHSRIGDDRQAVEEYIEDPEKYGQEVMQLARLYTSDPGFRQAEIEGGRRNRSIQTQRLFGANLNARASARDYADLMARIVQNGLSTSYVNILVRRVLEWPMAFPENQEIFSHLGYKNGIFPGILTTVYYGQRLDDGALVVVALFYRDLPMSTYRLWRRELPHDELARWILADPEAIATLRMQLCCRSSD